jgi:ATP-dependent protease ClpP protease subunit
MIIQKMDIDCADTATINDNKLLNYVSTDGDVYIMGEFDSSISQHVVPAFKQLIENKAKERDAFIQIFINSNGGYAHELYNLLSLIELAHARGIGIVTIVMGRAFSCGSMLAIHGDHRVMYKYARHIIHLGQQGSTVSTEKQIEREHQSMMRHFSNIREMYKKLTKLPAKELEEALTDDSYSLSAEDCLRYGICDEILGYTEEEMDKILEKKKEEKSSKKKEVKKTSKKSSTKKEVKKILMEKEEKNDL